VSKRAFLQAMAELGLPADLDEVTELFRTFDADNRGAVDCAELHAQLRPGAPLRRPPPTAAAPVLTAAQARGLLAPDPLSPGPRGSSPRAARASLHSSGTAGASCAHPRPPCSHVLSLL
jgi:hypothetical protein